jgi:hypothetical protein
MSIVLTSVASCVEEDKKAARRIRGGKCQLDETIEPHPRIVP